MSESYRVPGVYVEEDNALALSIQQGETAVPVFVGHFNAIVSTTSIKCLAIESWLDFTKKFNVSEVVDVDLKTEIATFTPHV
ncbi:hypothetical protein SB757_31595, partial [Pseudomonas sp. SIMBA_065]